MMKNIPKAYYFFGVFCALFVSLMVFVEIKNGRFWTNDFKVYYDAVQDYFSGITPYNKAYGLTSGFFKYPPTTLFIFFIYKGLPFFAAQILHIVIMYISYFLSIILIHDKVLKPNNINPLKKYYGLLYVAFLITAIHLVREFHMGNINLIILVLFLLGLNQLNKSNFWTAVFWSFMIILKPIIIVTFIPLAFYKKWKIIFILSGFGLIFFFIPVILSGWSGNLTLWNEWFDAILFHGDYIVNQSSMSYLAKYYFEFDSEWMPSLITLSLLMGFFLYDFFKLKIFKGGIQEWLFVFLAFTPNFFKTDTEHFILSLPLIMLLVQKLIQLKNKWTWIPFVIIAACFSLNSNDLLGKNLSDFVSEKGLLGIANLLFIVYFILISWLNKHTKNLNLANE